MPLPFARIVATFALLALSTLAAPATARAAETRTLTVAGGCFWCVESDFESVRGVSEVVSGFAGGTAPDPTYEHHPGYREAARISFDPDVVSVDRLLFLFFRSIDPTDAGGQFCDRGPSYTTAIFAADPAQKKAAEKAKAEAQAELGQQIVTPILGDMPFYPASAYHQNYYRSDERLAFTSVGIGVKKSVAYQRYRKGCGRDARIEALWGKDAPFIHHGQ